MNYLRKTSLIEGIGDELVYATAAFLAILIPLIIYLNKLRERNMSIHPENAENVSSTRERIQHENQETLPFSARTHQEGQLSCPICLGSLTYGIDTNCGHFFCGNCIVSYWEHGSWLGAVSCPVCRTKVTLLLINFTAEETETESAQKREIEEKINLYNRRFSGAPRTISEHLRDLPTLLRHALSEFFSVSGLMAMFRLRVVICFLAALMYFISPLDILPEAVFGIFGFLDDLFIILLLAIYISIIYRQIIQNRANRENTADNTR